MLLWKQDFAYTWLPTGDFRIQPSDFLLVWHFGREEKNVEDTNHMQRPPKEEDMDFKLDN